MTKIKKRWKLQFYIPSLFLAMFPLYGFVVGISGMRHSDYRRRQGLVLFVIAVIFFIVSLILLKMSLSHEIIATHGIAVTVNPTLTY